MSNPITEQDLPERRRAFSVRGFCEAYDISDSLAYELIAEGKLQARKMGSKTLIDVTSAEAWFDALPAFKSGMKPKTPKAA